MWIVARVAPQNCYREMKRAMRAAQLRFTAPMSLRHSIERALRRRLRASRTAALFSIGFAMGTAISNAVAASLVIAVLRTDQDQRMLDEVLSAHVRSLQGNHLTDVQTSDQHTVKPWFNGKLDLAPPVVDLTAQGFRLIGGRLDYLDGKTVASIVYRRRTHVINLFVAQGTPSASHRAQLETMQGFNIRAGAHRVSNSLQSATSTPTNCRSSSRSSKSLSARRKRLDWIGKLETNGDIKLQMACQFGATALARSSASPA